MTSTLAVNLAYLAVRFCEENNELHVSIGEILRYTTTNASRDMGFVKTVLLNKATVGAAAIGVTVYALRKWKVWPFASGSVIFEARYSGGERDFLVDIATGQLEKILKEAFANKEEVLQQILGEDFRVEGARLLETLKNVTVESVKLVGEEEVRQAKSSIPMPEEQKSAIYDVLKTGDVNQALAIASTSDHGLQTLVSLLQSEDLSSKFDQRIAQAIELLRKSDTDGNLSWIVSSWSELLSLEEELKAIISEIWHGGSQFPLDDTLPWPFDLLYFCVTDATQQDVTRFARRARDMIEKKEFQWLVKDAASAEPYLKSIEFLDEVLDDSEDDGQPPTTPQPMSFVIIDSDSDGDQAKMTPTDTTNTERNADAIHLIPGHTQQPDDVSQGNQQQADDDNVGNLEVPTSQTLDEDRTDRATRIGQLPPYQESSESNSQRDVPASYVSDTSGLDQQTESTSIEYEQLQKRGSGDGELPQAGDEEPHVGPPRASPEGAATYNQHTQEPAVGSSGTTNAEIGTDAVHSMASHADQPVSSSQGDQQQADDDNAESKEQPTLQTLDKERTSGSDPIGGLSPDQESAESKSQRDVHVSYVSDTSSALDQKTELTSMEYERLQNQSSGDGEQPEGEAEEPHGSTPRLDRGGKATPPSTDSANTSLQTGPVSLGSDVQMESKRKSETSVLTDSANTSHQPDAPASFGSDISLKFKERGPSTVGSEQLGKQDSSSQLAKPKPLKQLESGYESRSGIESESGTGNDRENLATVAHGIQSPLHSSSTSSATNEDAENDASFVFIDYKKEIASHYEELAPLVSLAWPEDSGLTDKETWPQALTQKIGSEENEDLLQCFAKLIKLTLEKVQKSTISQQSLVPPTPTKVICWLQDISNHIAKDEEKALPLLAKLAWPKMSVSSEGWQENIIAECRKDKKRGSVFVQVAKIVLQKSAKPPIQDPPKGTEDEEGKPVMAEAVLQKPTKKARIKKLPQQEVPSSAQSFEGEPGILPISHGEVTELVPQKSPKTEMKKLPQRKETFPESEEDENGDARRIPNVELGEERYFMTHETLEGFEIIQKSVEVTEDGGIVNEEDITKVSGSAISELEDRTLLMQSYQGPPGQDRHEYGFAMEQSLPVLQRHQAGGQPLPYQGGIEFRLMVASQLGKADTIQLYTYWDSKYHTMFLNRHGHYWFYLTDVPGKLEYFYALHAQRQLYKEYLPKEATRIVHPVQNQHTVQYDVATFSKSQIRGRNTWKSCWNGCIGRHLPSFSAIISGEKNVKAEILNWVNQLKVGWEIGKDKFYCNEQVLENELSVWLERMFWQADQSRETISVPCTLAVTYAIYRMKHKIATSNLLTNLFHGLRIHHIDVDVQKILVRSIFAEYRIPDTSSHLLLRDLSRSILSVMESKPDVSSTERLLVLPIYWLMSGNEQSDSDTTPNQTGLPTAISDEKWSEIRKAMSNSAGQKSLRGFAQTAEVCASQHPQFADVYGSFITADTLVDLIVEDAAAICRRFQLESTLSQILNLLVYVKTSSRKLAIIPGSQAGKWNNCVRRILASEGFFMERFQDLRCNASHTTNADSQRHGIDIANCILQDISNYLKKLTEGRNGRFKKYVLWMVKIASYAENWLSYLIVLVGKTTLPKQMKKTEIVRCILNQAKVWILQKPRSNKKGIKICEDFLLINWTDETFSEEWQQGIIETLDASITKVWPSEDFVKFYLTETKEAKLSTRLMHLLKQRASERIRDAFIQKNTTLIWSCFGFGGSSNIITDMFMEDFRKFHPQNSDPQTFRLDAMRFLGSSPLPLQFYQIFHENAHLTENFPNEVRVCVTRVANVATNLLHSLRSESVTKPELDILAEHKEQLEEVLLFFDSQDKKREQKVINLENLMKLYQEKWEEYERHCETFKTFINIFSRLDEEGIIVFYTELKKVYGRDRKSLKICDLHDGFPTDIEMKIICQVASLQGSRVFPPILKSVAKSKKQEAPAKEWVNVESGKWKIPWKKALKMIWHESKARLDSFIEGMLKGDIQRETILSSFGFTKGETMEIQQELLCLYEFYLKTYATEGAESQTFLIEGFYILATS